MTRILIFAGTTEGRRLAEYLKRAGAEVLVSVATEYGETAFEEDDRIKVHAGRMDLAEMKGFLRREELSLVVDATHPYAQVVSANIRQACQECGAEYYRLLRAAGSGKEELSDCILVDSTEEAVAYLKETKGNVLVATGSKELSKFTAIPDYEKRIFARVLSTPEVVAECAKLGFCGKNLICMQGPFSEELNVAMLKQCKASYLVTKESGKAGGTPEKIRAARKAGAKVILIGRPEEAAAEEEIFSEQEIRKVLLNKMGLKPKRKISLIGIGMGNPDNLTVEARNAIQRAELLIGAKRMLESVKFLQKPSVCAYKAEEIHSYVKDHPEYEEVAILLSGDVGFYSGAKKLYDAFQGEKLSVYSGISSVVYLCGKLHTSWEDVYLMSLHGRQQNLIAAVKEHKKVFALIGQKGGIEDLCRKLLSYGFSGVKLSVGENLSYDTERIREGTPEELLGQKFEDLSVVLIENEDAKGTVTHGLEDEAFLRAKVPMTKQGIRSISLSKLRLSRDSVVYDVGAGTGSVSVEMALQAPEGMVYAIEKKPEAVQLILQNKRHFQTDNLTVIEGLAPEAMEDLPCPTHVFVGGSSGNLAEILKAALGKNKRVRVVINAIALETVSEALECIRTLPVTDVSILTAMIGESKQVARYHMMMGQNPVYVIAFTGGEGDE